MNYKKQDDKAERDYDKKEYITADWVKETLYKQYQECTRCRCQLEMEIYNGAVKSNITVDRIDNLKAHLKSNCVLMCLDCNVGKSNK